MKYAIAVPIFLLLGSVALSGCHSWGPQFKAVTGPMTTTECIDAIHDGKWAAIDSDHHCRTISAMIARKYLIDNPDFMDAANEGQKP